MAPPASVAVSETFHFGLIVFGISGGIALAVLANKVSDFAPIPTPAIFLLAAAGVAHFFPGLGSVLSIRSVERLAVVALVVILFDGGMRVGWKRFRAAAVPITLLGIAGTFATAALIAVPARYLFGFDWTTAGLLGAALAPTDPAVMFSVLGRREIAGRTGTILEGESGANDPAGIALMLGLIEFATHAHSSFWVVVREFCVEMAVGLAIGAVAAYVLLQSIRRFSLADPALYPLRALAAAGLTYGVASVAHGSGFLAVFVLGILVGDAAYPNKQAVTRFHTTLASLAEIVVFVALGLTVATVALSPRSVWLDAIWLTLLLAFAVRPIVVGALLAPATLRRGERLFVMWGGLKGAVPILLAAFALLEHAPGAERIYGIVFVVVAFSVLVQGATIPLAARVLGVPMTSVGSDGR
jgi:potassium/hydrogen antiporter